MLLALAAAPMVGSAAQGSIVQTKAGRLEGVVRDGIEVFKGIPFAAPPIGALRWKPPEPVKPWAGILSATAFKPACIQKGMYPAESPAQPVSEDCLYLNIWKPAAPSSSPLPVMVWIYGGSLRNGSAALPLYAGDELARHGVIVVTVNYRLGVFGFLALPDLTAKSTHHFSGNYGLLDQLAALKWVHDNIAAFGGAPENVTVFGQSSGSISISALTASPLARGLFQKVIGESGGLFEPMELLSQLTLQGAEAQGRRFMTRAGATSLAALRAMPADKLLALQFSPNIIVDGYVLPRTPWQTYTEGKANRVSLLLGWNADEGAFFVGHDKVTPASYRQYLAQSFPSVIVRLLAPSPGTDNASARAAAVAFNTDLRFRWDMWEWAQLADRGDGDPVYLYAFTREPPYPPGSRYHGLGAAHGLEMQYVFDHLDPEAADWSETDRRLSREISTYWTNFARTGNPNGPGLPDWPAFSRSQPQVMHLGVTTEAGPLTNTESLQRISRFYGVARFVMAHWVLLLILVVLLAVFFLIGVVRFIRRRRRTRLNGLERPV